MEGAAHLVAQSKLFGFLVRGKTVKQDFERVAIPHLSYIYTAAFYLTKNEQEAEDLVQETYLRGYRFFHKFEPGTNCRAWLLSIQRHLFVNRYQRRKKQPQSVNWEKIEEDYDSFVLGQGHTQNPESILCSQVMGPEVERALKELPEEFRTAIILVDIDE